MVNFSLNLLKFEDIRSQIVEFLKENSEYSSQFDFTGANIGLIVDTMSYITMMLSYQMANTASNMFLDSTSIRKNAVSIAKTMGYRPQRPIASKIYGTVEYRDITNIFTNTDKITIPAYTPFVTDLGYQYINLEDIILTLDPDGDTSLLKSNILLYEGIFKKYTYLGNNNPFQTFTIPSKKVSEEYFDLKVRNNNENFGADWTEVKQSFNMLDKNSYFVEEDLNTEGHVRVVFGDGVISNYPKNTEIVEVYYIETNANLANNASLVKLNTDGITTSLSFPGYNVENFKDISTTTKPSFGGVELETLEVIQERAAKSFATAGKAVTRNDFITILANNPKVYRSTAIGGDTLYPGDPLKLGNIYLSLIPYITDMQSKFWESNYVYIDSIIESGIYNDFEKYKIISTQLNFLKPSYVGVDITPYIELSTNISTIEKETIKTNIKNTLQTFYNANFDKFEPTFRASKINSVISDTQGVVSSYFNGDYYFAMGKNSFYELYNVNNNVIFLPIVKSQNGLEYTNFVKTNKEQMLIKNYSENEFLPINERTIYGQIKANSDIKRFVYNEDTNNSETCDLKIYGKNEFFDVYRVNEDATLNKITNVISDSLGNPLIVVTPTASGANDKDNYNIVYDGTTVGTVKRTYNTDYGFKGLVENQANITLSPSGGDFYKVVTTVEITGTGYESSINTLNVNDVIMYNGTSGLWQRFNTTTDISAIDDTDLYNNITANAMYLISGTVSGDFNGGTIPVDGGDYIIYSPITSEFQKLNLIVSPIYTFAASSNFVKEVVDYEIKYIMGLNGGTAVYNGRTSLFGLVDKDLIYYNPVSGDWVLMGNYDTMSISIPTILATSVTTGGSLDVFDYDPVSGIPIGTTRLVSGTEGDFGGCSTARVNWISEQIAYEGDIILYIGNGKWNIYQPSQPETFNIDGTILSDLPIKIAYGDTFTVAGSGTFNIEVDPITYYDLDYAVYIGSNKWMKLDTSIINTLDPTQNLPPQAVLGDMYRIIEDGSFNDSMLIKPYQDKFVQGDVIIFNGSNYTKVNEYTFEYYTEDTTEIGKNLLNDVELNSVFMYDFDLITRKYIMYFNDIFHNAVLGSFRYNGVISSQYDVGKIIFNTTIKGYTDILTPTDSVSLRVLFDDLTTNKIKILPKNKKDISGQIISEQENNFDTNFNTFIIANTKEIEII